MALWDWALHFLWPLSCELCGAPTTRLCDSCLASLPLQSQAFCLACGDPLPCSHGHSYQALAGHIHQGPARQLLLAAKYGPDGALARRLGGALAPLVPQGGWTLTVIPPRPVKSLAPRGWDPLWWLARGLAEVAKIPLTPLLRWDQMGPRQKDQATLEQRRAMSSRSFRPLPGKALPPQVLLLDDVSTSGTTLLRGAQCLYRAGAQKVVALCWSRAI